MKTLKMKTLALVMGCGALFAAGSAMAEQPLIQAGKQTLFERVVSHPGAALYADATTSAKVIGRPTTFTSYYVYERKNGMSRVGVSSTQSDGWIADDRVTNWPQAITMVFTEQEGRDPVVFMKSKAALTDVCEAVSIAEKLKDLKTRAESGKKSTVMAVEPTGAEGAVAADSFYLLPVIGHDNKYASEGVKLLNVASIDPGVGEKSAAAAQNAAAGAPMTLGLAIVIDTTISMQPYITRTLAMIRSIYDDLQKSKAKDSIAIAVVAFRNDTEAAQGIGYRTRVVSDFKKVKNRQDLEKLLSKVTEARVSTHSFDEDSFAGIKTAVDDLSWQDFDARSILFVSDAGPLSAEDPHSGTKMSAEGMADLLRADNIHIMSVHLKTPEARKVGDIEYAEKNYRELSRLKSGRENYVAITAPNAQSGAKEFGRVGKVIADTFRQVVESETLDGLDLAPLPANATAEERARYMARVTGYSMKLQYLGNRQKTRAPRTVDAWIADVDLVGKEKNPQMEATPSVYPAVLLNKMQLALLKQQLEVIRDTARKAFYRDDKDFDFFDQLVSAAALVSRDPTKFSADPSANLVQKGLLLEVLADLPYESRVAGMKKEDWLLMSTGEQDAFIDRIDGLIARYDAYDQDNKHWEGFGSTNTNEWVYRVPLSMLP